MVVVPLGLAAALAFAVAFYLKHRSAERAPVAADRAGQTSVLVRATIIDPLWLAALLVDAIGVSLQIVALRFGALAVVQPLLISTLLFALVLRHFLYRRVPRRDFGWALLVSVSLAGFLLLAGTFGQAGDSAVDRFPAVIATAVGATLAGCCVILGRRGSKAGRTAALLGVAVGVIHAGTAALLKTLTSIGGHGVAVVLASWQLYAVIAVGALGLLLNQMAFQAAPITASLPAVSTVDPLASIAIGIVVFDERIRQGALIGGGLAGLLVILGVAIIQLTRDPEAH